MSKANHLPLTKEFLESRYKRAYSHGFTKKAKWIEFCELLLDNGFSLTLHEAQSTVSKYITIRRDGFKPFKVRFSNHKPIKALEIKGSCDFFVGVTNLSVTTTEDAISAVESYFSLKLNSQIEEW